MPTLVVLLVHLLIYTYEGHYPIFVQLYWIELDGVTKKPEKNAKTAKFRLWDNEYVGK